MNKFLLPATSILFIILISIYPVQSLSGAQYALSAFLGTVLPALLPFFAATAILVRSGACDWIARIFSPLMRIFKLPGEVSIALVVSFLSGYPAGAKAVSELYGQGRLSDSEASVAFVLCSTTGPAFIVGTIGTVIQISCGFYLLVPHFIAALLTGLVARFVISPQPISGRKYKPTLHAQGSAADIMVESIGSTADGLWKVASFMMFFSSLTFVLMELGVLEFAGKLLMLPLRLMGLESQLGTMFAGGMLEMTAGCLSAAYSGANMNSVLPLISYMLSFGGLSILMQIFTFSTGANVKFKTLLFYKQIQGTISMLLTTLLLMLFPLDVQTSSMSAPLAGQVNIGITLLILIALLPLLITLCKMLLAGGWRRRRSC